jgi:hypothetical protein
MKVTADVEVADVLISAVRRLASASSLNEIADIVKRAAWHLVQADGATFVLRDGGECHYLDEDAIAPLWKGRRFPLSTCVSGWAMLYRQQAIIPDVFVDARIPQSAYRPTFVKSLVMTPVGTSEPWAAIGVYWARAVVPSAEQARCLQALADSTALAMENVRVRSQVNGESVDHSGSRAVPEPVRMCAWTRRFWWDGSWVTVERFLRERFGLQVTHGISEEAARSLETMADVLGASETVTAPVPQTPAA